MGHVVGLCDIVNNVFLKKVDVASTTVNNIIALPWMVTTLWLIVYILHSEYYIIYYISLLPYC
jgi:hypothetical protein